VCILAFAALEATAFAPSYHGHLSLRGDAVKSGAVRRHSPRMQSDGSDNKQGGVRNLIDLATSSLATLARGPPGGFVSGYSVELSSEEQARSRLVKEYSESLPSIRPKKPLELYEFEACPFCRKVREALSMLDIDTIVYPCPSEGDRYRPKVMEMGGKTQFPYLMDPNTSYQSYESDAIIQYLFQTYGDGIVPLELSLGPVTTLTCGAVSALRPGKGRKARSVGPAPEQVLELWGYESAPPVRLVRETLCELELPYKSITVARGSIKSQELKDTAGKFQVPYLVDPNTGVSMFESADICAYLEETYGSSSSSSSTTTTPSRSEPSSAEAAAPAKEAGGPSWEDAEEDPLDPMNKPPVVVEGSDKGQGPGWDDDVKEEAKDAPVVVEAEIVSDDDKDASSSKP